jgi:hypothetical protein
VTNLIVTLCHDGVGISESALVSRSLVISARDFYNYGKSGLGLKDSLFFVLDRESTPHVWRREAVAEGKKYTVCGADRMEASVRDFSTCTRCSGNSRICTRVVSGNNRVCTWVVVETVAYVRTGFFWAVWQVHTG